VFTKQRLLTVEVAYCTAQFSSDLAFCNEAQMTCSTSTYNVQLKVTKVMFLLALCLFVC